MPESPISDLPAIASKNDLLGNELFVLQKGNKAYSLLASILTQYIDRNVFAVNVQFIAASETGEASYTTDEFNRGTLNLKIPIGNQITGTTKSSVGNVDTYTFTFNSPMQSSFGFTVTNGTSIERIEEVLPTTTDEEDRTIHTFRVILTNGYNARTFYVKDGKDGICSPSVDDPLVDSGSGDKGESTRFAREDHVHPAPSLAFSLTLASSSWSTSNKTLTITNDTRFKNSGYSYIITPDSASFTDYCNSKIYADDVTQNDRITFHCEKVPSTNLTVNVLRTVSTE